MQKILITVLALSIMVQPLIAQSESALSLKNITISMTPEDKIEVKQGKDVAVIEVIGAQKFKLNGVTFVVQPTDTVEIAMEKIKKAYKAGNSKNALLEQLFIEKAFAVPPLWFTVLFSGMVGAAIGKSSCERAAVAAPAGFVPVAN